MKPRTILTLLAISFGLVAGASQALAQANFKAVNGFEAGGVKLPRGEYQVTPKDDTHLTFRLEATGKEFQIPFLKRLPQPNPPKAEPQLVVDAVGNFAPSYTEYMTDYVLAEVWLPGADGYLIHIMKGAHASQVVKGEKAK